MFSLARAQLVSQKLAEDGFFDDTSSASDEEVATNWVKDPHVPRAAEQDVFDTSPNRPHPSLDFPPLYFALKKWPWLSKHIKPLYKARWYLSYPFQRKLPFSKQLRKLGVTTSWGEALLLFPYLMFTIICVFYTFVEPDVVITGKMARFGLIAAIVFGQKNSLLTLCLGMPFDRALYFHKIAGYNAFINGLLHTWAFAFVNSGRKPRMPGADVFFADSRNISGSMLMILLTSIVLSSVPQVRHVLFEVFYYFHIVFILGMVACAYFHSGYLIPCLAFLTTGIDMFIRKVIMAQCRYPKRAFIKAISDSVVEISFPKLPGFDYNPGQYIYIAIPELSWFQFHPFSISSSPKQSNVTLHIRCAGSWTNALHKLAQEETEVSLLIEGPYGNLSVDLFGNDRYKHVVLVSGGIGFTPMKSICNQLLHDHAKGRRTLESIKLLWTERDPVLMKNTNIVTPHLAPSSSGEQQQLVEEDVQAGLSLSSRLLLVAPASITTDAELALEYETDLAMAPTEEEEEMYYSAIGFPESDDEFDSDNFFEVKPRRETSRRLVNKGFLVDNNNDDDDETTVASDSFPYNSDNSSDYGVQRDDILELHVHLTGNAALPTDLSSCVKKGRPDIPNLLMQTGREAAQAGHKRVAVLVCAAPSITKICRNNCIKLSNSKVRFDFHEEGFA